MPAKLTESGIAYELLEHGPVYTIDEMKEVEGMKIEDVCKNLFLRDEKGKRHFLVVLDEAKSADLKAIRAQIGSTRLSFGSEERLMDNLGLIKGAVTSLGVLNDGAKSVDVGVDEGLRGRP
ncbi:MAG: prolyl-tRNA synthetase associated domain-containing protein, partial [Cloacibacillus sp.]|nr:prolyl-tRNA synthetase associated domain-containing protein [Cloacibacillus sp.]